MRHSPNVDDFTSLVLSEAPTVGIFMETSSHMCDQWLIPFPAPVSSLKDGKEQTLKFKGYNQTGIKTIPMKKKCKKAK